MPKIEIEVTSPEIIATHTDGGLSIVVNVREEDYEKFKAAKLKTNDIIFTFED